MAFNISRRIEIGGLGGRKILVAYTKNFWPGLQPDWQIQRLSKGLRAGKDSQTAPDAAMPPAVVCTKSPA
jgi:hypothetical protein